jgi:hypothetical protein
MIIHNAKKEELPLIRKQRIKAYREHEKAVNEDH